MFEIIKLTLSSQKSTFAFKLSTKLLMIAFTTDINTITRIQKAVNFCLFHLNT